MILLLKQKKYEIKIMMGEEEEIIVRKIDLFDATVRIMEGTNQNRDIFNYDNNNDSLENLIEIWFKASKISRDYWCMYETTNRVKRFYLLCESKLGLQRRCMKFIYKFYINKVKKF